jgi:hypothetical protein
MDPANYFYDIESPRTSDANNERKFAVIEDSLNKSLLSDTIKHAPYICRASNLLIGIGIVTVFFVIIVCVILIKKYYY